MLARSYAKVRVLLADPSRAMVDNNRFLALARRLTSCIDLRAMSPEYPASAGAFIIADDKALVYRLQADRWDGMSDMNDPAGRAALPEFLRRGLADQHAGVADAANADVAAAPVASPV